MSIVQPTIDAVASGALYALVALGLALVFGVMRIVNFAHGEVITIGGYVLALSAGLSPALSVALCIAACVALSLAIERVVFRRLRDSAPATSLVATFAVALTLQAVWLLAFGPEGESADVLGFLNTTAIGGELRLRWITLVMLAVGGVLLAAVAFVLARTSVGLQMRAAATDFGAARLLGVRADRVVSMSFLIAGLLAAAVAVLLTVERPLVTPTFGLQITIVGLVGAVVGGMDRLLSATLGGFAIGFATSVLGELLPTGDRVFLTSAVFALVVCVLVWRPAGLFTPRRARAVGERA